jgi:ketosteroid isomerase-like protein
VPSKLTAAIAAIVLFAIPSFAKAGDAEMDQQNILATIERMTAAFARGDIDTIMSTYEPGASVVATPGTPVWGDQALRAMFRNFIDAGVAFKYGKHEVVVAGDVGLHLMQWSAPGPNGEMSALSVAVLRRQPDNSWKMVIDHPFGDGVMKALP